MPELTTHELRALKMVRSYRGCMDSKNIPFDRVGIFQGLVEQKMLSFTGDADYRPNKYDPTGWSNWTIKEHGNYLLTDAGRAALGTLAEPPPPVPAPVAAPRLKLEQLPPNPIPGAPDLREEARLDTLMLRFAREVRFLSEPPEWLHCTDEAGKWSREETIRAKNALLGRPRSDRPVGDAQEWADAIACLDERVHTPVAIGGAA